MKSPDLVNFSSDFVEFESNFADFLADFFAEISRDLPIKTRAFFGNKKTWHKDHVISRSNFSTAGSFLLSFPENRTK